MREFRQTGSRVLCLTVAYLVMGLGSRVGAEIRSGEPLPPVVLEENSGGQLDGSPWDSNSLKERLHILMYVDPDEVEVNAMLRMHFPSRTLIKKKFGQSPS